MEALIPVCKVKQNTYIAVEGKELRRLFLYPGGDEKYDCKAQKYEIQRKERSIWIKTKCGSLPITPSENAATIRKTAIERSPITKPSIKTHRRQVQSCRTLQNILTIIYLCAIISHRQ